MPVRAISDDAGWSTATVNADDDVHVDSLSTILWWFIAAMVAALILSFTLLHLSIDFSSNPSLVVIAFAYAAMAWFYKKIRCDASIAVPIELVGQMFLILLVGLLLTYASSAVGFPYRDAELNAIDEWIGFSRQAFRLAVFSVWGLPELLDGAYLTIQAQTFIVPFVLIFTRRVLRLQVFVLALGIALTVTCGVSVFVPALNASIYVDLAPLRQAAIPPGMYTLYPTLEALRSGTMSVIRLNEFEGLLAFPSFHTANAILFAWGLWTVPHVRWIGVVANILMIMSTPLTGAHYIIDLVAGAVVAIAAIAIATTIGRRYQIARRVGSDLHAPGSRLKVAVSPPS